MITGTPRRLTPPRRIEENVVKVSVDQDACVSSGQCALTADDVFDQRDSDGVVELLDANPPQQRLRDVQSAAAGCPAMAITVRP